jgi:hypothetical protein
MQGYLLEFPVLSYSLDIGMEHTNFAEVSSEAAHAARTFLQRHKSNETQHCMGAVPVAPG